MAPQLLRLVKRHPAGRTVVLGHRCGPKHQDIDAPIGFAVEPLRQADRYPATGPRLAPGRRPRLDLRDNLVGDMGINVEFLFGHL